MVLLSGAGEQESVERECRERVSRESVECHCLYLRELSDNDKDGRLSVEEFTVAMHLIEKAKKGLSLPHILPTELSPASGRLLAYSSYSLFHKF